MVLVRGINMPASCAECDLCDNYCLVMRKPFMDCNPNEERMKDCPLLDVYVDEDGILHAVR